MDAFMIRIPVPLAITSGRSGDLVTITLDGELDVGNVGLLDGTIRVAEKEDCKKILVDLQELSFIDSSGLELLLEARRRSDRIAFVPSESDAVKRLLSLTNRRGIGLSLPRRRGRRGGEGGKPR